MDNGSLVSEVRSYNGVPWLHINGRPYVGGIYLRALERYPGFDRYTWDDVLRDYKQQFDRGVGMFLFHTS